MAQWRVLKSMGAVLVGPVMKALEEDARRFNGSRAALVSRIHLLTLLLASAPAAVVAQDGGQLVGNLVDIPGGSFMMGGEGRDDAERPVHRVTVKPFRMMEDVVTFAQWDACVSAGGCSHRPDDRGWGRGSRPVINVSLRDITGEFIPWLNSETGHSFRLPSEAEWEYAARAGTTTPFSTGECITTREANYDARYYDFKACGAKTGLFMDQTVPGKAFPPNAWGLYGVHGNVWEWTRDCWHENYRGAPADGSAWTEGSCERRVLRGGSWISSVDKVRSASRYGSLVSAAGWDIGFRLVQDR